MAKPSYPREPKSFTTCEASCIKIWKNSHGWSLTKMERPTRIQSRGTKAIECVEFGCSLPNLGWRTTGRESWCQCKVVHESLGIVAGITPFNFPLMVLWMLPQALVGGNAFILKPSEQVPLSVVRLAEMLQEAGLPDGIFNFVNGGKETVEALCDNEDITALSFVGSTRANWSMACAHKLVNEFCVSVVRKSSHRCARCRS